MKRVLIIEDDKKFRVLLKRLLEKKFRKEVLEAAHGAEGLEVYKNESPDLIFLDISMPIMDGYECLTRIREEDQKIPVVILTCISSRECVERVSQLGIDAYIVKSDTVLRLEERLFDIFEKMKRR